MKVQVIKNLSPRAKLLAEVFPNNDLRNVTKTINLTQEEFEKLYNNTSGSEDVGYQYSNMNRRDFMEFYPDAQLVTENVYDESRTYWKTEGCGLGDNITSRFDAGWVTYYQRAGASGRKAIKADPVPDSWGVLMINRWWYLDKPRRDFGFYPAARKHSDGSITVYKTIRWW